MFDYSGWERKLFNVTGLKLDPLNPRVSGIRPHEINQPLLINHFLKNYDVYSLARSIADNGFFPDEVIIVLREDEMNRYVLEGNRRVAALKVLLNPEAAPEEYKKRFRILSRSLDRSLLKKVQAVVAPSREAATPIIIEKHTHTTIKPWSVLMEAGYVGNIVEKSPEEEQKLKEMNIDLNRFIKMDRMYKLACALALELPEDVADSLRNKEKFPFTNVERLYITPQIREVLGISDDLRNISDFERFKAAYKIILTDIARKNEDSRSLGKDSDRERYANEVEKIVASSKRAPKSVTVAEVLKQTEKKREEFSKKETEPKPRSKRESRGIIPSSFAFRLDQGASVKKLCDELKKMSVKDYPNASALSFRVLLEKSLRLFMKMKGVKTIPAPPIPPRKDNKVHISEAQLGQMLEYIAKKDTTLISDRSVKGTLRNFRSSPDFPSLSTLNNIIHNEEMCLSPEQTKNLWPPLERLFIIMLSETGVKNGHVQDTT